MEKTAWWGIVRWSYGDWSSTAVCYELAARRRGFLFQEREIWSSPLPPASDFQEHPQSFFASARASLRIIATAAVAATVEATLSHPLSRNDRKTRGIDDARASWLVTVRRAIYIQPFWLYTMWYIWRSWVMERNKNSERKTINYYDFIVDFGACVLFQTVIVLMS